MDYIEVNLSIEPSDPGKEILVAELSLIDFESFDDTDQGLKAYIPVGLFDESLLTSLEQRLSETFTISHTQKTIKSTNWNAVWESNYSPVTIKDLVYIYAPFHKDIKDTKYQILIEPKMSFGTAHHETTSLVIEMMLEMSFQDKTVLDMGCGTGVLAILAEKMGASKLVAIDNDTNAFENSEENVKDNNCSNISVHLGGAEQINGSFDVIIANINKNILLSDIKEYAKHLNQTGSIVFSGFYVKDLNDIKAEAKKYGLTFDRVLEKNQWLAAKFNKH